MVDCEDCLCLAHMLMFVCFVIVWVLPMEFAFKRIARTGLVVVFASFVWFVGFGLLNLVVVVCRCLCDALLLDMF